MRVYDIAVTSLAIHAPRKWTDNVLSQHSIPDVDSMRQGITRRIPHRALIRLAVIRELHTELGISVADAVAFASRLLDSGHSPVLSAGQLTLTIDLAALRRTVDARLAAAMESAPSRRRGRPPRRPSPA